MDLLNLDGMGMVLSFILVSLSTSREPQFCMQSDSFTVQCTELNPVPTQSVYKYNIIILWGLQNYDNMTNLSIMHLHVTKTNFIK